MGSRKIYSTGLDALGDYFRLADTVDMDEGMVAYERYNMVMRRLAEKYGTSIDRVCAAFCSLSPNSDYHGNLRSTVSVLEGVNKGLTAPDIIVSTYGHCKQRALAYARGDLLFENNTTGPKILNFYFNILKPRSQSFVTIDGHMAAMWKGRPDATMKDSLISKREYHDIAHAVKSFAFRNYILPNQMQAILWFTRKRLLNVKYETAQFDLFGDATDVWKTARSAEEIMPYRKADLPKIMESLDSRQLGLEL